MPGVVITATERSTLSASAPSYDAITRALQAARIGLDGSNWIGPPRVTRVAQPPAFRTTVAALYAWPSSVVVPPVQALVDSVARQLRAQSSDWGPVTAYTHAPGAHGEVEWWRSGQAAVTRTRDEFPTEAGRLDAQENPTGPTTNATHPTTVTGAVGDALGAGGSMLSTLLVVGVLAGGVYLVWRYGGEEGE